MSRSTVKDPAKSKSSETFFKVLRFIGRYRFLLILSIVLAAVSVILQLYVPILFGNAIDQVIAQHQVNFEMMWYYLSRILVMVILSSAATWLMNVINNRMTYQTVKPSDTFRYFLSLTLTDTVPVISSAVLSQIQIFCPMVCCLDLPSFFPES